MPTPASPAPESSDGNELKGLLKGVVDSEWMNASDVTGAPSDSRPIARLPADSRGSTDPLLPEGVDSAHSETILQQTRIEATPSLTFGGYELLEEIARGGMGVVYQARQVALDRIVALKLVLSGKDASSSEVSRFYIEAKAAARLDHPHIVPVYEIGEFGGQQFFSMGFVDGPSLSVRLSQQGPLPYREAAELMRKIADAVHYAHRAGVVHRDLKPGNVLITQEGEPKVTDFGLAKRLDSQQSLTATGQILGTPSYMAPEQALGDNSAIGPWTDIYSLGATLFAALVGRPPFVGTAIHELLISVVEQPAPSLRSINPQIPAALDAIVAKCLAKTANERYATAGDLATALKDFLEADRVTPPTRKTGLRVAAMVGGAALVIGAIFGGMWLGRQGASDPDADRTPSFVATSTGTNTASEPEIPAVERPSEDSSPEKKTQRALLAARDLLLPDHKADVWKFRYTDSAAEFVKVFKTLGFVATETDPVAWAESLKDRPDELRESILLGLENWELSAVAERQTAVVDALRQAQEALETLDWRRTVRLTRGDSDERILLQAVREALSSELSAEQVDWLTFLVGTRNPERSSEAMGVLRGLQQQAPKSFVTNTVFATSLRTMALTRPSESQSFYSEAIVPLRAAAKSQPKAFLPQAQLLAVYEELGNADAANTERERLYQLTYPVAWPLVVEARKTRAAGQYAEAVTLLGKALQVDSNVPTGQIELAAALLLNRQTPEGETLLKELATAAVDDSAAYQVLVDAFRIVDQPQGPRANRDPNVPSPSADRVWNLFVSFRRTEAAAPPRAIAPFNTEQAQAHQEAWAKHLGVPVEYTNSIGMKFRLIPPGEYVQGNSAAEVEALRVEGSKIDPNAWYVTELGMSLNTSTVMISKPFYFGVTEVTQHEYETITGQNPSGFSKTSKDENLAALLKDMDTSKYPVENINLAEMQAFSTALAKKEGHQLPENQPDDPAAWRYRLPTEAEWEYACRAGTNTRWWFGDTDADPEKHMWLGKKTTHRCGEKPPNPFGLFDINGNVWEVCQDNYLAYSKLKQSSPRIDPLASNDTEVAVGRGGALDCPPFLTYSRYRIGYFVPSRSYNTGFRLVLNVDEVRTQLQAGAAGERANPPPRAVAPFDADQAKSHQEAWAKHLGVPVEYTNSIGIKFRLIPPGEFVMGSASDEVEKIIKDLGVKEEYWINALRSETPAHRVILTQPLYVATHEVTQSQYETVIGRNPSHFSAKGAGKDLAPENTQSHPVEMVSWRDGMEFCERLAERENLVIPNGEMYRLPTDAEWEFACRAGTTTKYWFGDDATQLSEHAWFGKNSGGRTHSCGEKPANAFGMQDMMGNLWEWTLDRQLQNYYQQFEKRPAIDPRGPTGNEGPVNVRGGCWIDIPEVQRSAFHAPVLDTAQSMHHGFRIALTVEAVRQALGSNSTASIKPATAPFDAVQAKAHQESWAKHLGVPVEYTNSIGMKFRLIPPGEFVMGSNAKEIEEAALAATNYPPWPDFIRSEAPQHRVVLTRPYYMGTFEVTQQQYQEIMGENPSHCAPTGAGKDKVPSDTRDFPVDTVSPLLALEFCQRLGKTEKDVLRNESAYRLSTEAEWEFACRAGTTTKHWLGDDSASLLTIAWCADNSQGRTHSVGEKPANPFGLHDMLGNAFEWVHDKWHPKYYDEFRDAAAIDPQGPNQSLPSRLARGGGWFSHLEAHRASGKVAAGEAHRVSDNGFRVVLSTEAVKTAFPKEPAPAIAPFSTEKARLHQEAWAKHVGVPVEYTNSIGMQFVLIPPGDFVMGSTAEEIEVALNDIPADATVWRRAVVSEAPQHRVVITRPFYLGRHKVTQQDYEVVMKATPSHFSATGPGKDAVANTDTKKHPVENITWNDAAEFCAKLSDTEGLQPAYRRIDQEVTRLTGNGYRLPTEAQWEFACRAGTSTRYFSGDRDNDLAEFGWSNRISTSTTHPVGLLKPNAFGAFDQHGNVWEWVEDTWDDSYYSTFGGKIALDPMGSADSAMWRVLRGGVWAGATSYCRSSARHTVPATYHDLNVGFRVSLPVEAVRDALQ